MSSRDWEYNSLKNSVNCRFLLGFNPVASLPLVLPLCPLLSFICSFGVFVDSSEMSWWDTKATCQMAHHWTGPAIASTIQRRLDQIHTLLDRHCHGPILPTLLATSQMEPHWMLQEMPWTILKPCSLTHMHRALRCPDLTTLLKLATWWMEPTCCEPATSLCRRGC